MNLEALTILDVKKKLVLYNMDKYRDLYEIDFPSDDEIRNKICIKNISDDIPASIELVDTRRNNCIELFRDFDNVYEQIEFGKSWYVVFYDSVGDIHDVSNVLNGLDEAIEYAIEHAHAYDIPVMKYTSIYNFDNAYYRHKID